MNIRPSLVNFRMDRKGGGIDGFIADHDFALLVHENQVRHAYLREVFRKRIEPFVAATGIAMSARNAQREGGGPRPLQHCRPAHPNKESLDEQKWSRRIGSRTEMCPATPSSNPGRSCCESVLSYFAKSIFTKGLRTPSAGSAPARRIACKTPAARIISVAPAGRCRSKPKPHAATAWVAASPFWRVGRRAFFCLIATGALSQCGGVHEGDSMVRVESARPTWAQRKTRFR